MIRGMRTKIRVLLSKDVVASLGEGQGLREERSTFIEEAIQRSLALRDRERTTARDVEIIDRNADRLNQEAEDVLGYQISPSTRTSSL